MHLCPHSQSHSNHGHLQPVNHPNNILSCMQGPFLGFHVFKVGLFCDFLCISNTQGTVECI